MNKLTLSGATDFALTTDALAFMQEATEAIEKLAALGGDNYIVTGCVVTGTSVSSGWMVLKGQLISFTGGTIQTNVRIVETVETITVDIASRVQNVYHAEFGTSADPSKNVPWADIKRPVKLIDVFSKTEVNNLFAVTDLTVTDFSEFTRISASASSNAIQFFKMGKVVVVTGVLWFEPTGSSMFFQIPESIGYPKQTCYFSMSVGGLVNISNVQCYAHPDGNLQFATEIGTGRHQFNFTYMTE